VVVAFSGGRGSSEEAYVDDHLLGLNGLSLRLPHLRPNERPDAGRWTWLRRRARRAIPL